MRSCAVFIVVLVLACGGAPPEPRRIARAPDVEACVRSFIAHEPMQAPDAIVRKVDGGAVLFEVTYGAPQDCPSGCFRSHAFGVAVSCDRVGWIAVHDYDHEHGFTIFALDTNDKMLFDESTWSGDPTFAKRALVPWLL